jgi:hypothetical protein
VVQAIGAARAGRRTGLTLDFQIHQALGGKGQELAHEVGVGALLDQLDQGHSLIGHRHLRIRFSSQPNPSRRSARTTPGGALRYAELRAPPLPIRPTPRPGTQTEIKA